MTTVKINNFTVEEIYKARDMRSQYTVAYLFATKYDQPPSFISRLWKKVSTRYFDDHADFQPEVAANILGGRIVYAARSKYEWVAVMEMEEPGTGRKCRVPVDSVGIQLLHCSESVFAWRRDARARLTNSTKATDARML